MTDETVESLKAALTEARTQLDDCANGHKTLSEQRAAIAIEKAAREKAEVERDEARAHWQAEHEMGIAAVDRAQKRIEALEVAARKVTCDECGWLVGLHASTNANCPDCAALNAALASPSESAPQLTTNQTEEQQ